LDFALARAKEAGRIIMELANSDLKVSQKSALKNDVVTNADMAADHYIIEQIRRAFPQDAILTEESTDDKTRLGNRRVWMIDPIDGTKNFRDYALGQELKTSKYFGVHIGLAVDQVPVLGVVFAPATNELFYAVRGSGAYKAIGGGQPKQLRIGEGGSKKNDVIFHRNFYDIPGMEKMTKSFPYIERPYGVVYGYYLAAIADGRIDAYVIRSNVFSLNEWDACAPQVVLEEAGGVVTNLSGGKLVYNKENPVFEGGVMAQARKGIIPFL
jgi:fructose-1,6-bisphosphatase/inositol monophosphatase family enzyme